MTANTERVGPALRRLTTALLPYVEHTMTTAWGPSWIEEKKRRDETKYGPGQRTYSLRDLRFLLRVITEERDLFRPSLGGPGLHAASELREVGNTYAHDFTDDAFTDAEAQAALAHIDHLLTLIAPDGTTSPGSSPGASAAPRPEPVWAGTPGTPGGGPQLVVSPGGAQAFRTIGDAVRAPLPAGTPRHILVEPGDYPGFEVAAGEDCVVTAVRGPGTVRVLPGPGAPGNAVDTATVTVHANVTLQGLNIAGMGDGLAVAVVGGSLLAERCELTALGSAAALAVDGRMALRACTVRGSAVTYLRAAGRLEDTTITGSRDIGVLLMNAQADLVRTTVHDARGTGVEARDASAVTIEDGALDAVPVGVAAGGRTRVTLRGTRLNPSAYGVLLKDRSTASIDDAQVSGALIAGLWLAEASGATLTGTRIDGIVADPGTRVTAADCEIACRTEPAGGATSAVQVNAAEATLRRCRIEGGVHGILAAGAAKLLVEDAEIAGAGANGLTLQGTAEAAAQRVRIAGAGANGVSVNEQAGAVLDACEVVNAETVGVRVESAGGVRITGGTIRDSGTYAGCGLMVLAGSHAELTGVTLTGHNTGIQIQRDATLTATGCHITTNRQTGVTGADLPGVHLTNTDITANPTNLAPEAVGRMPPP